jgi:hypothetical protein
MVTKNLDFDFPMQFDQEKTHQSITTSAAQKFGDQNLDHQIAMELDDTRN